MSDQPRLSPERRAAMGEWLQGHIARRRRRRRRLAIAGAAGAGVLTLGLAAAIVLAPQEVQDRWVECYPEADLSSPYATGVRDGAEPVGDREAYALSMCENLWEQGLVDGTARDAAPELVLCRRADLSLLAFPRDDSAAPAEEFCRDLGLYTPGE